VAQAGLLFRGPGDRRIAALAARRWSVPKSSSGGHMQRGSRPADHRRAAYPACRNQARRCVDTMLSRAAAVYEGSRTSPGLDSYHGSRQAPSVCRIEIIPWSDVASGQVELL